MKYRIGSYFFFFLLGVVILSACQNRPKEVLGRKKMERLLYDVYIAEAIMENDYQRFNTPEKKEAYINRLFTQHGVTSAEWDSSLSWYSDQIDLYLKMNDSVKVRLQRSQREMDAEIERLSSIEMYASQSTLKSYIPKYYSFTPAAVDKGFRFTLDSLEIESKIPENEFSFVYRVIGIPDNSTIRLVSLLALNYGDSTLHFSQTIDENKTYRIHGVKNLPADSVADFEGATLKTIHGFFHLRDSLSDGIHIQLYDIRLGNEHEEKKH